MFSNDNVILLTQLGSLYEGNMKYKFLANGLIVATCISGFASLIIPIYTYITDKIAPFHYGVVLFVTSLLGIGSTYIAHWYDKKRALEYCYQYKFLAYILDMLFRFRIGIVTVVTLTILLAGVLPVNHFVSYDFSIFEISIVSYLVAFYYANKIDNSKLKFVSMAIAGFVAALAWTLFSYMSYYSGVRSVLYQNQMGLFHATKAIIVSDLPEERKLQNLKDISNTTGGEFSVKKDGKFFYQKESSRDTRIYNLERIYSKFENGEYQHFQYGGHIYELEYKYANQPYYWWGIIRAMTFSILPDVAYGYTLNGYTYYNAQKYARSTQFWGVFWIFYCIVLSWQYYKLKDKKQNEELIESNQEKEAALDQLQEALYQKQEVLDKLQIAYSAYDHMHDEFDKIALRDTKQQLQGLHLSWSEIVKNILADSRHSLKNKLQDQPLITERERTCLDESYKVFADSIEQRINQHLANFRDTILLHQKELFQTLDYKLKLEPIGSIIEYIENKIPKNYYDKRRTGIDFVVRDEIRDESKCAVCEVNLNRVYSIIENILKNSSNALGNKSIEDDTEDQITLFFELRNILGEQYFAITVLDNAGGFKEDIVDKIYKYPVESSDKTVKRMGKGSLYVKYFADRMNAKIIVDNIINENNEVGAQVMLLIPVVKGANS